MNPPPRRPDDHDFPPLPPRPGEASRPGGDDPPATPGDPALDDSLPVADLVTRDPLLDDPLFAELVKSSPTPDISLEPAATGGPTPLFAEPVTGAEADLPVAEPVRAVPVRPPATPEVLDAEPAEAPPPLPRAHPVRPPAPPPGPRPATAAGPRREPRPVAADVPEVRSRPMAACGVIGCLAAVVVGAVGFLAFVAISVLGHLGDRIAEQARGRQGAGGEARPGPVAPTTLAQNTILSFPDRFDAVGRGAGGRYLLLRIPARRELAVFDPNRGELLTPIPLGEANALFAAGAAKVFVYRPKTASLDRYDLLTGKMEKTTVVQVGPGGVDALAIGARADGPVYLLTAGANGRPADALIVDGSTLKSIARCPIDLWIGRDDGRVHARPSDDGTVVGVTGESGALVLRFTRDSCRAIALKRDGDRPQSATPAPGGEFVYTPRGVFSPEGTPVMRVDDEYFYTFPPAHGKGLYLSLPVKSLRQVGDELRLHLADSARPVGPLSQVKLPRRLGTADDAAELIPPDQRVHLWPAAGVAAVLPTSNTAIEVYKVDVGAALKKHKGDYLVIGSDPPTTAVSGGEWKYTPVVWAPEGRQIKVTATGPDGVTAHQRENGAWEVVWAPPPEFEGTVTIQVRAEVDTGAGPWKAGAEHAEQTFQVVVDDPNR